MTLDELRTTMDDLTKSENETFKEFITEAAADMSPSSPGIEARAKDVKLDQILEIKQELADGSIRKLKFKVIEVWPNPKNFFTCICVDKPNDAMNFWTLFYNSSWYIKKANKALINVRVNLC